MPGTIVIDDMLRLNDPEPFPPVVPQMRYRAEVVRAVCHELPIDTDDASRASPSGVNISRKSLF